MSSPRNRLRSSVLLWHDMMPYCQRQVYTPACNIVERSGMAEIAEMTSLADELRDVARARIMRAAHAVMSERGLDTTVDDVARVSGVSRRTIFRYFESRDKLIAAVMCDWLRNYAQQLPRPAADQDADSYLQDLLLTTHRLNSASGRLYWEVATLDPEQEGDLGAAATERLKARTRFVTLSSATVWKLAGGKGRPPGWLVDAFAIHLSAFTTQALAGDFDRSPEEVAAVAAKVLSGAVRQALAEQR
jgi:AcrR family transcriptional regulator